MGRTSAFHDLPEAVRARRLRPLAIRALASWPIEVRRVRLVTNGYNAVFRVDAAEGTFALRVNLPRRADAELRAELAWLAALATSGRVRVPESVATRDGARWAVAAGDGVPGARRCVLFRWLPGRSMTPDDPPDRFLAFGAAIAELHAHAASRRLPRGIAVWDEPFPEPSEPPVLFDQPLGRRVRDVFTDALAATEDALARLRSQPEGPILTHHDLHVDNVLVDHRQLAVIDFDDAMAARPAQDLGSSIFQNRMRGCPPEAIAALRAGYETVRTWPDERDVETFVAAAAMSLANAVYQDFDPDYRAAAGGYATRWAEIAAAALRAI